MALQEYWPHTHTPSAALKTIYTGGILPLLLYGAPVWIKAIDKACYTLKLDRVQRLINIKIAKAYRTVSNEALCIFTGLTPIAIKIEEAAKLYQLTRGSRKEETMTMTWGLNTGFTPQKRQPSLRIKTRIQVQYKYSLTKANQNRE